ncbi:GntR family transcriptional regulator [Bauldia sp.]|uniref:GntR family transcriptional regulator n=1 Tax=Bauldia sp. TaxID=2575872 RepID=UPI003BABF015
MQKPLKQNTTPSETDFLQADGDQASTIYELIRSDILKGQLTANERLKVAELAKRYGTSTNPVREALQQLRGEGFVVFLPNRGARVRPIDEDYVRDIYEIAALIEPHLIRWFIDVVSVEEIAEIEDIQRQMEEHNFRDYGVHSNLDTRFHSLMYERHYNRHAVDTWRRHRQILGSINVGTGLPFSLTRRAKIMEEHRALIEAIKNHRVDDAAKIIATHVTGSGEHIVDNMRSLRRQERGY